MRRLLGVATAALVALAVGVSAKAAPITPQLVQLERKIEWQQHHIRQLEHRRAYLHRYIQHLRHPSVHTTSASTSYSPGVMSAAQVASDLRLVGFPEYSISQMVAIIYRESRFNPRAVNGGGAAYPGGPACGLTQLFPCPGPGALDPITNLRYALLKFKASGFAPWS